MRSALSFALTLAAATAIAPTAVAQVADFENATTTPFGWLPDGYAGYSWTNGFAIDPLSYFKGTPSGGFGTGVMSGKHVLSNGGGNTLTVTSTNGGQFDFMGGSFASAWRNGLILNIRGFVGSDEIFTQALSLDWSSPQNVSLGFFGVDRVVFETSGGDWDPNLGVPGNRSFAADDLIFGAAPTTVTPEPVTWALMATGLVGMAGVNFVRRRRARRTT